MKRALLADDEGAQGTDGVPEAHHSTTVLNLEGLGFSILGSGRHLEEKTIQRSGVLSSIIAEGGERFTIPIGTDAFLCWADVAQKHPDTAAVRVHLPRRIRLQRIWTGLEVISSLSMFEMSRGRKGVDVHERLVQ